jgi:signal transduction histidine kinase
MDDKAPAGAAPETGPRRRMLLAELLSDGRPGRVRRTPRDWLVDALIFGWTLLWWLVVVAGADLGHLPDWYQLLDPVVGMICCLAVWLRRRWPLGLAVALLPASMMINTGFGALMVVLFNAGLRLPWRSSLTMLVAYVATATPYLLAYTLPYEGGWVTVAFSAAFYLAAFAWGVALQARRQELVRLRQDAVRERAEHARRLADTRRAERTAIAREMHDVLAHRISLLSVHAAALAYRTGQSATGAGQPLTDAQVAGSAQIIRDNAHQALEELREVLTVLRAGEPGAGAGTLAAVNGVGRGRRPAAELDGGRPQPLISDVGELVREAEAAGQRVEFRDLLDRRAAAALRPQPQRTVYRVVQEGLTNARKHAPGTKVTVELAGRPGRGLTVRVCNPLPTGMTRAEIPGAQAGLTGLGERAALDGGSLRHGSTDGEFQLLARLPWAHDDTGAATG